MKSDDRNGWVVRTPEGQYLFPYEGDVSFTPNKSEAGLFNSYSEAHEAAVDHCSAGFKIVPARHVA
ncbi:hypothetical protein [Burkholderia sp. Tr-20390]|uniref:hypothetical protein n=1 Tax=Burkholderia sp. Tr-20390 TaxID=2703904 RepID=UPI0019813962|nr:hypothetical protein [Burkholderia sp. Tr-20390]MBN3729496.1 hypothetical protein [Burkholderia sp. Tr-20390]